MIARLYEENRYLLESNVLSDNERKIYNSTTIQMDDTMAQNALKTLSVWMERYYGKKVFILLDEYDTPMQEAYVQGYWDEFTSFVRSLFNASFKTNPYLERAIMTGITRVRYSKCVKFAEQTSNGSVLTEPIFSDLNNLRVVTTTSNLYADCFGFTEEEVFAALDEYGMGDITNIETLSMFMTMFRGWFKNKDANYNDFVKALLKGSLKEMNIYMNDVALATFSSFDTGKKPSEKSQLERFYHGFVLELLVELRDRYQIRSNRESGYGRYDVMLTPVTEVDDAIVIEFKVHEPDEGESLKDTVRVALAQIMEKNYDAELLAQRISADRIRHYGFAFEGKKVLIGQDGKI